MEKLRRASSLSNSIFCSAYTHIHVYIQKKNTYKAMRYACVTRALRIAASFVCTSRGRSGITCGSTAFDNLTAFCNLSFYLLSIHHLAFPILGRSSIGIRFTVVVTVKSRTFHNEKCTYRNQKVKCLRNGKYVLLLYNC